MFRVAQLFLVVTLCWAQQLKRVHSNQLTKQTGPLGDKNGPVGPFLNPRFPIVYDQRDPVDREMCIDTDFWPSDNVGECLAIGQCSDGTVSNSRKLDAFGCTTSKGLRQSCQICLKACPENTIASILIQCNTTTIETSEYMFPTASCLQPLIEITHPHAMASLVKIHYSLQDQSSRAVQAQWVVSDHISSNELVATRVINTFQDLIEWNATTRDEFHFKVLDVVFTTCPQHSFLLQRPGSTDGLRPNLLGQQLQLSLLEALLVTTTAFGMLVVWWIYPLETTTRRTTYLLIVLALWALQLVLLPAFVPLIMGGVVVAVYLITQTVWVVGQLFCGRAAMTFPLKIEADRFSYLLKIWFVVFAATLTIALL